MAMENSAAFSNNATKEISSASKADLPPVGIEQQDAQQNRTEESLIEEKPKDGVDPEGDFVDAETVAEGANMPAADVKSSDLGTPSEDTKSRVADDDENVSVESFDSALERMAAASTGDPASPECPSSPISLPSETTQQISLRQLNQMNSGVSSLDTAILQNVGSTEFKDRVVQIANRNGLAADSEDVKHILSALLPLIEGRCNKPVGEVSDAGSGGSVETNVVDSAEVSKQKNSSHVDANGDVPLGQAEAVEGHSREVQTPNVDDDAKNVITLDTGDDLSKGSLVADSFKRNSDVEGGEDSAGDVTAKSQASKLNESDQEPEVIDWDDSNESDVDEHVGSNVQAPPSEVEDTNRSVYLGGEEPAGLQPETGTSIADHKPKTSGMESEGKEAPRSESDVDIAAENAVVDDIYEPGAQHMDVSGEEHKGSETLDAVGRTEFGQAGTSSESKEDSGLCEGEKSKQESSVEAVGDSSAEERGSVLQTVVDSKKESSMKSPILQKTVDVSSKSEPVDEKSSAVAAATESSKASTTSGNDTTSSLGGAGPSLPVRPAGLGRSVPSLEHAPRPVQRSSGVPVSARQAPATDEDNGSSTDVSEGSEGAREKLQMIRVKFLRLANRLGQSAHNVVVAQVLYRLGLAEQLRGGRGTGRTGAFSFERASALAEEQEALGADDLEFGCTIMVLGKSGVGKSATINSLFDEVKSGTNAYSPATNKVQEIIGTVHGIKLRVVDTPGLLTSFADQRRNARIMSSVKRFIKKSPPDIVLYFDRLDMQSRDYGDLPLLRTITDTFGSAVWFNAIVVLTHASSAPPDGANGVPVSYEMFVAQRSHVVQQTIRQAAGDMRLMNPVSLVENHSACRRNRAGERVLPNGQVWKPQLLLLCFASKILAEANSLLKLQDSSPAKPFGVRTRVPPLPFLLSSLLQSRAQLKLPDEQIGSDDESEDESDEEADSEGEEEYDDLPPFRRLTRDELKLLDKEQRKIYAEELEYREKLFMKKQLKDERTRKKELKRRMAAIPKDGALFAEESLEDENASASVPVPMPDMALPPSFDSDNPTYRYRYLDTANQWLVRPVLETHGWDHDSGYDGLNVEKVFVVSKKIPASISGQVTKDKKEANLQMECAASFKNGEGKFTQTGLDIQTIAKDVAYTLRSETRFDNFKRNKTTFGLAVTLLGDTVAAGMKIEDRLLIGKRVKLVFNGGALTGRSDVAYGGSLEATIRDKDYPIGQFLSTFGLSVMDWHGDLAIGGNLQVQCKLGKTMTIVRGNLNNRKSGQISIRVSNSEQLQMALIGLIPLLRTFINNRILSSN